MLHIRGYMLNTKKTITSDAPELSQLNWTEETVMVEDVGVVGPAEWFHVEVGRLRDTEATDSKTCYVRPVKPYHNFVFEDLFNFGCHCDGYNKDRIIKITC